MENMNTKDEIKLQKELRKVERDLEYEKEEIEKELDFLCWAIRPYIKYNDKPLARGFLLKIQNNLKALNIICDDFGIKSKILVKLKSLNLLEDDGYSFKSDVLERESFLKWVGVLVETNVNKNIPKKKDNVIYMK